MIDLRKIFWMKREYPLHLSYEEREHPKAIYAGECFMYTFKYPWKNLLVYILLSSSHFVPLWYLVHSSLVRPFISSWLLIFYHSGYEFLGCGVYLSTIYYEVSASWIIGFQYMIVNKWSPIYNPCQIIKYYGYMV